MDGWNAYLRTAVSIRHIDELLTRPSVRPPATIHFSIPDQLSDRPYQHYTNEINDEIRQVYKHIY